ncbi:MAG: hypothetical protein L3K18_02075 [Thermoplasmata archaeon]|nr:hypothetical protein [Thermoplasmata archaeon]
MAGDGVGDRVLLSILFLIAASSTVWGLYQIYYVSPTSPSGLFNTVLGLLVLLVTWAYLLPFVVPKKSTESGFSDPTPPRASASIGARARSTGRPAPAMLSRAAGPRTAVANLGVPPPAPVRPVPRAASAGTVRPAPARSIPPRPAPSAPTIQEEREIAEILADLPEPLDPGLAAESPDDVVRRLDELLRDLSVDPTSLRPA